MTIEQGDPKLLESDTAKRLLASKIPARYAYTALDGTPRIVASWFAWTGEELVMPTFISAPHVSHAAYRVRTLRANPDVAVSVDTETWPPEVLSIRGRAEIAEVDGVVPEYAQAAHHYLGSEQATAYLAQIDHPSTRMARIAVRPTWVGLLDFQTRLPSALGGTEDDPAPLAKLAAANAVQDRARDVRGSCARGFDLREVIRNGSRCGRNLRR